MAESITWKIGGPAGFGIMTIGMMFSKVAARAGFHLYSNFEYPSLIRGGHNVTEVRFSPEKVFSQQYKTDLLVALNEETVHLHQKNIKEGGAILYDGEKITLNNPQGSTNINLLSLPLATLIKQAGISTVSQNNIALGASCALLNLPQELLFAVITDTFVRKGDQVVAENKKAATLGFEYAQKNLKSKYNKNIPPGNLMDALAITGNEAVALGTLAAGCAFYAAYPMTPSSNILHYLAAKSASSGMVVKHAEDEISVINMAIGASFAGSRAMVGTSGGGFSLMVEGLGLAAITETPIVIVIGQRPGPATGMPTWTGQADLHFVINASQDEFPRIVLAPGDQEEAFYLTQEAFNLADIYQTPVFVLTDKYVAENHMTVPDFDPKKITQDRGKTIGPKSNTSLAGYLRYKDTSDGVSPRVLPGTKGVYYLANSYEHNEYGFSSEDAQERIVQVDKRNKKLKAYINNLPPPTIYGKKVADITIVAWGSTKAPILQALADTNYTINSKTVNFLHLTRVWPLNNQALTSILSQARVKVIFEGNSSGQMAHLIREQTGAVLDKQFLKYNGRPFYPEDILASLNSL